MAPDEVPAPHLRSAAPRAADRLARPDDRLDGAADDRWRPRRPPAPLVGRDGLPAGVDGRRAAVREARRSLRTEAGAAGRTRDLPRRLGAVRCGADHAAADRVPRRAGPRRRRAARARDGGRRRSRRAARSRPVPGAVRRRLRDLGRRGPAAGRFLRRQPLLAVDLLHQPPARAGRAGRDLDCLQLPADDRAAPHRLPRHGRARRRALGSHPLHEPRRHVVRLGLAWHARGDRGRRRAARAVPVRGVARGRADPAAGALPQPDVPDDERDRLRRRVRALRVGDVRAVLPAGRQGPHPDRVGAAHDADDGGPAHDGNRKRLPDLPLRALPPVPDHRHGCLGRRAVPAFPDRRVDADLGHGGVPAPPRARARDGHAGARARSPERRRLPVARRRHVRRVARSFDRRQYRRVGLRSDLHEPAHTRARPARPVGRARTVSHQSRRAPRAPAPDPRGVHRSRFGSAPPGLSHGGRCDGRGVRTQLAAARRAAARDDGIGRTRPGRTG